MNEWIDNLLRFDELLQLFRVFLAIILGACIGFERERYGRPAGLRTHMIVCVASALAMLISIFGFNNGDPARLAAQVISGIGFIGAGTIIRGDKDITGITTAATIWICAIIGLACGCGYYFGAILTTFLSLIILSGFSKIESKLSRNRKMNSSMIAIFKSSEETVKKLSELLNNSNIVISGMEYKTINYENKDALKVNISFAKHTNANDLNQFLASIDKELQPIQCKLLNEQYTKMKHI